jgi:hypothetical protein
LQGRARRHVVGGAQQVRRRDPSRRECPARGVCALWKSAVEAPDAQARGKALEDFAAAFFGDVFKVSERNSRTDTEEPDLVLERSPRTNPRFGKEAYLFVECKNWPSRPVDQATISQLYAKLHMRNLKQGFVLATGRFTVDAAQQARYAASKEVEIILIDGHAITDFLAGLRPVGDLLVELHRRQILRTG